MYQPPHTQRRPRITSDIGGEGPLACWRVSPTCRMSCRRVLWVPPSQQPESWTESRRKMSQTCTATCTWTWCATPRGRPSSMSKTNVVGHASQVKATRCKCFSCARSLVLIMPSLISSEQRASWLRESANVSRNWAIKADGVSSLKSCL